MDTLRATRDIPSMVEVLAATAERLEAITRDLDDDALDFAPEGEWSARTVLAHLRDDEFMVMRLRLERMVAEEHPTLAPFDQEAWAASRWTGRDSLEELLADFRLQREASLMVLTRLEGDDWQRTGVQPEYGAFDVSWWLQHWAEHDEGHIAQIEETLKAAST